MDNANAAIGADVTRPVSDHHNKVATCVNGYVTFVNIGALEEHHRECLIGSSVACYAGTTTPITMPCPDAGEFLCIVCDLEVKFAAVSTYKFGPKVFCSSNCQVQCQHELEVALKDF